MSPLQLRYPTTVGPEQSKIAEEQRKDLKSKFMKMIVVPKEETNTSFKEIQEHMNKQLEEMN